MKSALILLCICALLPGCNDSPSESPSAPTLDPVGQAGTGQQVVVPAIFDKPFKSRSKTTATVAGPGVPGCDGNPDTGVGLIFGTGIATHLGRNTSVTTSEIDAFGNQCGHAVVTAANGDVLEFDISGGSLPPDANLVIEFWGTFTFTGGTGQFSDATGGGDYEGTFDLLAGAGQVKQIGTISY